MPGEPRVDQSPSTVGEHHRACSGREESQSSLPPPAGLRGTRRDAREPLPGRPLPDSARLPLPTHPRPPKSRPGRSARSTAQRLAGRRGGDSRAYSGRSGSGFQRRRPPWPRHPCGRGGLPFTAPSSNPFPPRKPWTCATHPKPRPTSSQPRPSLTSIWLHLFQGPDFLAPPPSSRSTRRSSRWSALGSRRPGARGGAAARGRRGGLVWASSSPLRRGRAAQRPECWAIALSRPGSEDGASPSAGPCTLTWVPLRQR